MEPRGDEREPDRAGEQRTPGLEPLRLVAIVPCHREPPVDGLVPALVELVGRVVLVDDGMPRAVADELHGLAKRLPAVEVAALGTNRGKGHAVALGIAHALRPPDGAGAVLVVDADGQHPPSRIPSFVAAAERADLVVGDRMADASAMPRYRWVANRLAGTLVRLTTGVHVPDSQCGMRLLTRRALHDVPFPGGRYEAETLHLRRCLRARVPVAWVPIPAVYAGEPSSFRWLVDSVRVALAAAGLLRGARGR